MMKTKIKRIIASICFLLILLLCFDRTANILEAKTARIEYTDFFENETGFDVIFLGTSHMYNGILPQELWKNYGITSFNWGYSNSTTAENYYILMEAVKYNKPKLVVIDLHGLVDYESYNNGKYRTDRIEQQHVQFDAFPFSMTKLKAVKDIFDDYEYNDDFLFDFLLYHTRWDELTEKDFKYEYSTQKGAQFLTGYAGAEISFVSEDEKTEINSVCSEYVQPIVEFCNENDIELLFVYLPFGSGYSNQRVSNSFMEFAESFGDFDYLNLIYTDAVNYNTDLYTDKNHLNYMGAYKVTNLLGAYIQEEYELADHRYYDTAYTSWWNDYEEYRQYRNETILEQENIYNILLLTYSDEYYIETYDNGELLVDNDLFLGNYFKSKEECDIYYDSNKTVYGETQYKLMINICDNVTHDELLSVGIKNSNMEFDVLE